MARPCHVCGVGVDPLRAPARIVGSRIVSLCAACAADGRSPLVEAPPPRAAVEARPLPPETPRRARAAAPPPVARTRPRRRALPSTLLVLAAFAAAALAVRGLGGEGSGGAAPRLGITGDASPGARRDTGLATPHAAAPSASREASAPAEMPRPRFVHPLPGPERELPANSMRVFGADRPGRRPDECGRGHCGVDLAGARGTPVMAVRDGVVVNVVRHGGGRAGRFVRIDHDDGMTTVYMHLDRVREDLEEGMRVAAGETIGTLGKSGVRESPPHLHFGVKVDGEYVDPEPYLREAEVRDPP